MTERVERRRWERLRVRVPMFLHRLDERSGRPALDFVTAMDISVGGVLLASPNFVSPQTEVTLEFPEVPMMPDLAAESHRKLRARVVRAEAGKTFLLALEFAEASRLGITRASGDSLGGAP